MKFAIVSNDAKSAHRVYIDAVITDMMKKGSLLSPIITQKNILAYKNELADCDYVFSTWGMPHFTLAEIKEYFPNVKAVFYAAGSVQGFAAEFLDCGIRVFSAWQANAVPVAQYTVSQILLANKGYFQAEKKCCLLRNTALRHNAHQTGNFDTTIGICGVGAIGGMVCEALKGVDCNVICYDPFLSDEKASALQVKKVSITQLFQSSDVISNHLANNYGGW